MPLFHLIISALIVRCLLRSTFFPYTTLFRSQNADFRSLIHRRWSIAYWSLMRSPQLLAIVTRTHQSRLLWQRARASRYRQIPSDAMRVRIAHLMHAIAQAAAAGDPDCAKPRMRSRADRCIGGRSNEYVMRYAFFALETTRIASGILR